MKVDDMPTPQLKAYTKTLEACYALALRIIKESDQQVIRLVDVVAPETLDSEKVWPLVRSDLERIEL